MDIPVKLLEKTIERGSIFHSNKFENINHGKFFVIIGESKEQYIGCFFINSNINKCIEGKQELINLQFPIKEEKYPFLKYFSFINCS